ncbi:hypothetical protein BDY19DRAFT_935638 [Irpex rosettiformis]|uniref:Uncharacterized protein n=1 Tax=Irpex rosettiformis TaxID=378272 RepID=A0ACB8U8M0_9APHY|nr:hypothetical protein BDY19DRAFT_935638 [Irpex rosettiformis]
MASSSSQDPSKFDITKDAHFSLLPCKIMSSELIELYRTGDYEAIARKEAEEQSHIKATSDMIASNEDGHGFAETKLANGEQIRVAWTEGDKSAMTYVRVIPSSVKKLGDGKVECEAQIASISSKTNTGTVTSIPLKNIGGKILGGLEGLVVGAIAFWFERLVRAGITKVLEQATSRLANALLERGLISSVAKFWLVEDAAPVIGKWGARIIGAGLGTIIGGAVVYGAVELFKYAFLAEYTLNGQVYNFDAVHDWQINGFYGFNEKLIGAPTKGVIPRCKPAGKVLIPGMNVASDVQAAAVYFKTFIFQNDHTSIGAFTVAGAAQRVNNPGEGASVGVNFAYRIEKATDNSMALHVGNGESAQSYFTSTLDKGAKTSKVKKLSVQDPVPTAMTSPELFNAEHDSYSCRIDIGTPPKEWHAVGV